MLLIVHNVYIFVMLLYLNSKYFDAGHNCKKSALYKYKLKLLPKY